MSLTFSHGVFIRLGSVLTVAVMVASPIKAERYFEVQFSVTQTNYSTVPQPAATNNIPAAATPKARASSWVARCIVGKNIWMIENQFAPNALDTCYCDGTNVLETLRIISPPHPSEIAKNAFPLQLADPTDTNLSRWITLNITPGEHPISNMGANLPWLVFCSSDYLRKEGRLVPLPGAVIRQVAESFALKDQTVCFNDGLGLPKSMDLLTSSKLLAKAAAHKSLFRLGRTSLEVRNAINPIPRVADGFLRGHYQVLDQTNIDGWNIPTSFRYEQFIPGVDGKPALTLTALGRVTNIINSEKPSFTLSGDQCYSAVDFRFRDDKKMVDEIHYAITNGQIPDVTSTALQKNFLAALEKAPRDPVVSVHYGIYVLFTVLLTGPVIAAVITWLLKNKAKKG